MTDLAHTTVLLEEAVDALVTNPLGVYVDGTFGRGGHTRRILAKLAPEGRVLAFDQDPQAVAAAAELSDPRFSIRHANFSDLAQLPPESVDGVLLDLGVSSPQIDSPERGFSFRFEGPLDMRMDPTRGPSVADWLAVASVREIAEVIRDYGEERFALPIAKAIVARRDSGQPVRTTTDLVGVVAGAVKTREAGQNPATRTFQALRIFINRELESLDAALAAALKVLRPGGRLVVIAFHSLEDRIVKRFIAAHARETVDRRLPFAPPKALPLKALGRVRPSEAETQANPRARSAVMRVAEKVAT
jgi:16S rRNA (cytosine1402-N4)-methyltransferase